MGNRDESAHDSHEAPGNIIPILRGGLVGVGLGARLSVIAVIAIQFGKGAPKQAPQEDVDLGRHASYRDRREVL